MRDQVVEKLASFITAAFGLVAALAWNQAIQGLFAEEGPLYFLATGGVWGYAIVVTVIAVIVTIWIGRISEKTKRNQKNNFQSL